MRALWPGKMGIPVLVTVFLTSFAVWCLSTPSIARQLFGEGAFVNAYSHPLLAFFGLPLLALVPLAAGVASPRGFWAWGFSAYFLPSIAQVILPFYLDWRFEGYRQEVGPPEENLSFNIAFAVITFAMFGLACTAASAFGAGLGLAGRRLWRRRAAGESREEEGPVPPIRARVTRALGRVFWGAVLLGALTALLSDTIVNSAAQTLLSRTPPWEPPDREQVVGILREPASLIPHLAIGLVVVFLASLLGGYLTGRLLKRRRANRRTSGVEGEWPEPPSMLSGGAHGLLMGQPTSPYHSRSTSPWICCYRGLARRAIRPPSG